MTKEGNRELESSERFSQTVDVQAKIVTKTVAQAIEDLTSGKEPGPARPFPGKIPKQVRGSQKP